MSNSKKAGNLLPKIGVYSFNAYSLTVFGTKDNPLFQAKAIIDYLGIGNVTDVMNRLDDDEKLSSIVSKSGQRREMKFVNESGLYHLIFQSRKPEARKFRKWVTGELLPTLRKTGRYELRSSHRALPREKSSEMGLFFDELTKWTTPANEREVAKMMNVTAHHVHEVARGRTQSYGVACMLVEFAKENRKAGVRRQPRAVSREADMNELMLEFTEE
jgi:prophage antirepressor-like protein